MPRRATSSDLNMYHLAIASSQSDYCPCPLCHRFSTSFLPNYGDYGDHGDGDMTGCIPESYHVNDQAETF